MMETTLDELKLMVRSRYGLVVIPSADEDRIEGLLRLLADHMNLPLLVWGRTWGLRRDGEKRGVYGTQRVDSALAHIVSSRFPALYHLKGLGASLADADVAERLKEVALLFRDIE